MQESAFSFLFDFLKLSFQIWWCAVEQTRIALQMVILTLHRLAPSEIKFSIARERELEILLTACECFMVLG